MKGFISRWKVVAVSVLSALLAVGYFGNASAVKALSPSIIQVRVDDQELKLAVPPYNEKGTVLVPMRPLFEALGIGLQWDPASRTVQGNRDGLSFKLTIDSKQAVLNGSNVQLAEAAAIRKGYTMVPTRFISEASNALVLWNPYMQTVYIYTEGHMQENGLTKEGLTERFNEYLKEAKAQYEAELKKQAESGKSGNNGGNTGKPGKEGMCSVWRYHPVYEGSLEWVPCP